MQTAAPTRTGRPALLPEPAGIIQTKRRLLPLRSAYNTPELVREFNRELPVVQHLEKVDLRP